MTSTMRFDRWEKPDASQAVSFDQLAGGTGLVPMIPATVQYSGGTATSNTAGMIDYSGVTSIVLNQVFGSYRNYRIIISGTASTNAAILFRLRSGGVDYAGTVHSRQVIYGIGTSVGAGRASGEAQWEIGVAGTPHYLVCDLYNPNTTSNKNFHASSVRNAGTSMELYYEAGYMANTNAYDSFNVYLSTGTMTGQIVVYGYNE